MTLRDPRDPMGPSGARLLADWLTAQPDGTRLTWGDAHRWLTDTEHAASWIDVTIAAACTDLGTGWTWTIISPDDEGAQTAWPHRDSIVLAVAPDVEVYLAIDPATGWYADGPRLVVPAGTRPDPTALSVIAAQAEALGGDIVPVPAWTETAVNVALSAWTAAHTGRTDLQFTRDRDWEPAWTRDLAATAREAATIDLGDGLRVSDAVLDRLLELGPDMAAEVTGEIKRVIGTMRENASSTGTPEADDATPPDADHGTDPGGDTDPDADAGS